MVASVIRYLSFCGIVLILYFCYGCTVTHEYGHKPELKLDNPLADETKLKLKDGGVLLTMKWDL